MTNIRTTTLYIFLIIILHGSTSHAQHAEEMVIQNPSSLYLHVHTLSFIKNNEYFNPIVEGHTLAGYHIHPYLRYTASKNITTTFGFFTRRDWADTKLFSSIMPTFTFQYQQQAATFLIGNLYGNNFHRLIRPFYDLERALLGVPEIGLQIYYSSEHTFMDIWLHWITLLNKHNNVPEELLAGLSFEQLVEQISSVKIKIPVQIMLYHLGGQGISAKDFSMWVGTIGSCIAFQVNEHKFLKSICLDNYYITSHYVKNIARPFKTGQALLIQLTFHTNWFTLQGSYWNGCGFSSENLGHPLYQSICISNKQVKYSVKHRHLALLHIGYQYNFTNEFKLVFQLDPYYDIGHHLFEHELGLYITYNPRFKLADPLKNDTWKD